MANIQILKIAKVAHQLNKAYCESIGDFSQLDWKNAPGWQLKSAVDCVKFHIENPGAGADASHNNWMAQKLEDGWVYGENKDADAKTHPCIVKFEELSQAQQSKDFIFRSIVHELLNF